MICRIGMAGSLAYEVHGNVEDAIPVYNALLTAREQFGIRRIGRHAYRNTHTENGFPQLAIHHWFAPVEGFMEFLSTLDIFGPGEIKLTGSAGQDITGPFSEPCELGWARMIKFDHDFIGREALEKEVANPRRQMVTLVWHVDDIMDVHHSQYTKEPYAYMDPVEEYSYCIGSSQLHADKVLKDGKLVGFSSGRMYSPYYREMISLCSSDTGLSVLGTEVKVLWGDPGTRQKEIRAIVSRFP